MQTSGGEVQVLWRGNRVSAFVPAPLVGRDLGPALEADCLHDPRRAVSEAAEVLAEQRSALPLLMRCEAVSSSEIDGVTARLADVCVAEWDTDDPGSAAARVAANLRALADPDGDPEEELSLETLFRWHRLLLGDDPEASEVGMLRTQQGWIGGTSPLDAELVTAPPQMVPALVEDLLAFVADEELDPIVQAAIADVQFRLIAPFADCNGIMARALTAWILTRRLTNGAPIPVSRVFAGDPFGYSSSVAQYRAGHYSAWICRYADAVRDAAGIQLEVGSAMAALKERWIEDLDAPRRQGQRLRRDANAWLITDLLARYPVLGTAVVQGELGIAERTASATLAFLVDLGLLTQEGTIRKPGPGRPRKLYFSPELLDLLKTHSTAS